MTIFIHRPGAWIGTLGLIGGMAIAAPLLAQTQATGPSGASRIQRAGRADCDAAGFRAPFVRLRHVAQQLGLSDAQTQQVRAIVRSHRVEWKALADRAVAARRSLRQSITVDVVDDAAIRQQSAQLAAVQADIAVARAHTHTEVWKVLTPEQRAKADSLRAERQQRANHRQASVARQPQIG